MTRLRIGKFCGAAKLSKRKLADQCAAALQNSVRDLLIFARIDHVNASAENGNCLALAFDGAAMSSRVDTARHAAEDRQAARGEITTQSLRHTNTIWRRVPRADYRQARTGECFNISAHIQDQRRIVNFAQALRPAFIVAANNLDTRGRSLRNLVSRQLQRFSQGNVLRRMRLQVLGFQLSQRGMKNILDAGKALHQFAPTGGTETRRKGKRQPVN